MSSRTAARPERTTSRLRVFREEEFHEADEAPPPPPPRARPAKVTVPLPLPRPPRGQ